MVKVFKLAPKTRVTEIFIELGKNIEKPNILMFSSQKNTCYLIKIDFLKVNGRNVKNVL